MEQRIKTKKIMKEFIILIVLFFSATKTIFSQIEFGVKAGQNFSIVNLKVNNSEIQTLFDENREKRSFSPDFHVGLFASKNISKKLSILSEVIYSREGYQFGETPFIGPGRVRLNYIDVPILLEYRPYTKLKLVVGPEIGYLMTAKLKSTSSTDDVLYFFSNRVLFGGILGVNFPISNRIEIEARYIHGLRSVRKVETICIRDDYGFKEENVKLKYQSNVFQISFRFMIKTKN